MQWAAESGGGGGSTELLAVASHNPSTENSTTSTSTTFVDVDATNAAITFTARSSGKVLLTASAGFVILGGLASLEINLRDGSGDVVDAGSRVVRANTTQGFWAYEHLLTGLASGTSCTYKLGMRRGDGRATVGVNWGAIWQAVILKAIAAP